MDIKSAQRDVQSTFLRASVGQAVSGVIWLLSAALGTWVSERYAILALVIAGTFIFPLTQLTLRLLGRPAGLPKEHPMNQLAMQVAFIVPLTLPVIGAAALYNINWFYPAFMLVLGTHYLPFIFLYGMWEFGVLAALLIGAEAWRLACCYQLRSLLADGSLLLLFYCLLCWCNSLLAFQNDKSFVKGCLHESHTQFCNGSCSSDPVCDDRNTNAHPAQWCHGYGDPEPETVIVVGFGRSYATNFFNQCESAGTVTNQYGVKNEETTHHTGLMIAANLANRGARCGKKCSGSHRPIHLTTQAKQSCGLSERIVENSPSDRGVFYYQRL